MNRLVLLVIIGLIMLLLVVRYYLTRNDEDSEEELSLKEQMLMGTSAAPAPPVPDRNVEVAEEQHSKRNFWAGIYSGKGPQPKYMRYIAGHERRRAIEAAKLAADKEKEEKNI